MIEIITRKENSCMPLVYLNRNAKLPLAPTPLSHCIDHVSAGHLALAVHRLERAITKVSMFLG